jgi:hypothetical protein
MQCRLDSFVQIDNMGAEMFAKTFQNVIGGIADHNFRETTGFVAGVTRAAESGPENIRNIAQRLNRVTPQERQEFQDIGDRIAVRFAEAQPSRGPRLSNVAPPSDEPAQAAALPRTTTK